MPDIFSRFQPNLYILHTVFKEVLTTKSYENPSNRSRADTDEHKDVTKKLALFETSGFIPYNEIIPY
jgi:hypothetical protein